MHFHIDGKHLIVTIAARALIHDGQPCRAKLDRTTGRIWLADTLPRHERRRELFHELRHAWIDARGVATDEEQDARQSAEMMDVVLEQYLGQGGDAVLESLNPPAEAKGNRLASTILARTEVVCGFCGAPVAIGSVATDPPAWVNDITMWAVDRAMLCTVCDSVTAWREAATAEGMPIGQLLPHPSPRVLTTAEARAWVGSHQELCRIRLVPH